MAKQKAEAPVFDLLARGATMRDAVKEALADKSAKLKSDPQFEFAELPSNKNKIIPLMDFGLQWALKSRGLPGGRILDIIGADGVGKSTLVFTILGWAMRHNSPGLVVESEGKPMDPDRVKRCLHPDPVIAQKMFAAISTEQAFELTDAIDKLERWVLAVRDPKSGAGHVPRDIPVVVVLDTFSKLMAPAESVAYDFYNKKLETEESPKDKSAKAKAGEKKKREKQPEKQELMGGSNMQHAKIAHKWTRRLPSFLTYHNCVLIVVRHQNDKVDMSAGGGGSFIPIEAQDAFNRVSIGGRAWNQSAAIQLILTREKMEFAQIRGERVAVARINRLKVSKNSYGYENRALRYSVMMVPRRDSESQQEMVLDFSPDLGDILARSGLLGVRVVNANSIAVKELGLDDATPQQVSAALHQRPDLVEDLGTRLGFFGYKDSVMPIAALNPAFIPAVPECP